MKKGATNTAKQVLMERLKAVVIYAQKKLQNAQARYRRWFVARLCRTNDRVSPGDFVYVETTLADTPH